MIKYKYIAVVLLGVPAFCRAQVTEVNDPTTNTGYHLYTGNHIVAPGSVNTVSVSQDAQVYYKAGEVIELKNGFSASGFNGNGFFHAFIDPNQSFPVNYDDDLFSQEDFDNHEIDVSKAVGYIPGSHSVTPTGAATYTIPIPLPPGTNGMVPSLAISYNSQSGNGIMGVGWNIAGLSTISRVPKTIYHDEKVEAVRLDATDNFALDGNRLIKVGNYYYTESETFSRIRGESVSGSTPQGFEVETKNGQTIYYGYTPDSRFYKENSNEILFWLINKIKDNYGNYVEFKYRQENREVVLDKISYTGNENAGLAPYNHIQFYYDYRDDKNTIYLASASIKSNLLLKKIKITADGQDFKTFKFTYGFNHYSFLKEVQEFGCDGSEVNSSIFKYGEDQPLISRGQINNYNGMINNYWFTDMFSGDYNGDGLSDLLLANKSITQGTPAFNYHIEYKTYLNQQSGNFTFSDHVTLPNDFYEINNLKMPNRVNIFNSDFTGDGKDDIIASDRRYNGDYWDLHNINIRSYNGETWSNNSYPTPSNCREIHSLNNFLFPGDYNGDGVTDFLTILANESGYKAFVTFPLSEATYFEIFNADGTAFNATPLSVAHSINIIDVDGDGKNELMVTNLAPQNQTQDPDASWTTIYSFQKIGAEIQASILYHSQYPTQWHTIYPGDFNGDGKTDLLTLSNEQWAIGYSIGTYKVGNVIQCGFNTEIISFLPSSIDVNDPHQHFKIGDYNGDGLADILHTVTNVPPTTTEVNLYYSKGYNEFENYNYTINSIDTYGTFTIGDFNGDGKTDEISKTESSFPATADILYFNKDEKIMLLHEVKNGFNLTTKFDYTWLSKGTSNYVSGNNPFSYPVSHFQKPIPVVNITSIPNGIGGESHNTFVYEGAMLHHGGRGFLGFRKVTSKNWTAGTYATVENAEPNFENHFTVNSLNQNVYLTSTDYLISEATNNYITDELGNNRFLTKLVSSNSKNHLTTTRNEVAYQYDIYGNPIQVTKVQKGVPTILGGSPDDGETTIITSTYGQFGSWIPASALVISSSTVRTEQGTAKPSYNRTKTNTYTNNGSLQTEVSDIGTTSTYSYSSLGNLTSSVLSAQGLESRSSYFQYDIKGRFVTTVTNGLNQSSHATYDSRWGKPLSEQGVTGLTITYEYDGFGKLNKLTDPHGTVTNTFNQWAIGSVDNSVFLTKTERQGSPENVNVYDAFGRILLTKTKGFNNQNVFSTKNYDEKGNTHSQSTPFLLNENPIITTFEYDDYNRIEVVDNGIITTDYSYSADNGKSTVFASINTTIPQQSAKTTDPTGKIIAASDIGGNLNYKYFSSGNIEKTVLNTFEPGFPMEMSKMEYDDFGRQTKLIDKNAGTTQYEYNQYGELTAQIDANNNRYEMKYDILGRLKTKEGPISQQGSGITNYTYVDQGNGINQISQITTPASPNLENSSQSFMYDNFHRLTKITEQVSGLPFITEYSYNSNNAITSEKYPSGFTIQKHYDNNGYLKSIKDENGSTTIFEALETNGLGQLTDYKSGNNTITHKTFNQYGLLQNINSVRLSNQFPVQDLDFEFDIETGNLNSRYDNRKQMGESFVYDELNRLISSQVSNHTTPNPYLYQPIEMEYAQNGNIKNKTGIGEYQYNNPQPNAVTGINNSNETISLFQQQVAYTTFDRPAKIIEQVNDNAPELELSFIYGPDYSRKKTELINHATSEIINKRYYSGNFEQFEKDGDFYKIHYIGGGDGLCGIYVTKNTEQGEYFYVSKDYLGSILSLTNSAGDIVLENNYDAWGRDRDPNDWDFDFSNHTFPLISSALPDPKIWLNRGYTGHEQIKEFALVNMNARLYDPTVGRMLAVDNFIQDASSSQGYNRYSYVLNNPLKYTDPSGENPIFGLMMIGFFTNAVVQGWANQGTPGQIMGSALVGAAAAGAGGYVGSAIGGVGFYAGFISGAAGGFTGGFIGGAGNAWINGKGFDDGISAGLTSGGYGALFGGVVGGLSSGSAAVEHGGNFLTGEGATFALPAPSNLSTDGKIDPDLEYSNACLNKFTKDYMWQQEGIDAQYGDGSGASKGYFHVDNLYKYSDHYGNVREAIALTRYNGIGKGYDLYFSKSAFASKEMLYLTVGHEYMHVDIAFHGGLSFTHEKFHHSSIFRWSYDQARLWNYNVDIYKAYLQDYLDYPRYFNYSDMKIPLTTIRPWY